MQVILLKCVPVRTSVSMKTEMTYRWVIKTIATEKNFLGRPSMWMETVTMPERTYQWRIKTIVTENLPISKFERMPSNLLASYVQPPSRIH